MDHKPWLWRKKSSEKTIIATDKLELSLKGNEAELQILLTDKAELENDVKNLNDKLSSALAECNARDDLVKKHAMMAQEAITGREKAEAEVVSLKQELDAALQQRVTGEERLIHLDAALKECMEQLCFVREEQEQRIHDAVMKASMEFEKSLMILEEKLAETSKRLAKLGVENTHFAKALLAKEKLIEDLGKQRTQAEADFNALMTRLDSTEKENASLKYEVRVLGKELEIRNEEREFNRRTADESHKQHLESVKKIAKLESECQRLRVLVRKRLPGPAALAKMKNEVEILGRGSTETRRKRLNSSPLGSMVDSAIDNPPDTPSKRINFLTEQLCTMEEENKSLKEVLNKKTNELQFSRTMYAHAASKLSEVESQIEELSKGHKILEPSRTSIMSYELSLTSMSDIGSDDKVSCAESRASALISESEHLRSGKQRESPSCKTVGASDIRLMDDFVEMEKLAIVSVNKPHGTSHVSPIRANTIVGPLETESSGQFPGTVGEEIVQVPDHQADFGVLNQEIKSRDILIGKFPSWLQEILELILEQNHAANRNPHKILEDVRDALVYIDHQSTHQLVDTRESSNNLHKPNSPDFSSVTDAEISLSEKNQQFHSDLSKSICKIVELIEKINLASPDNGPLENLPKKDGSVISYKNTAPSGYVVRVFQWKTSELGGILQQFVHACYGVLNKEADFNKFANDLSTALEWIMNHCFSLQDVSSMRDEIKKHFDWDEARSESEAEVGMIYQFTEADRLHRPRGQSSCLPTFAVANDHYLSQKKELPSNAREEHRKPGTEFIDVEAGNKVRQECLVSAIDKSNSLMSQLQESQKIISNLQNELEILKKSKEVIEDQVKIQKKINEDLDTQLKVARVDLNEACQKFSSLEVELEDKSNCCEELEATCLELQLQLESVTKSGIPTNELKQDEKQIRTDWEITTASEKLAECQETIFNLGKQLKALASPREAALFDKVIPTPTDTVSTAAATTTLQKNKMINQRSSLLDQMMAEDNADVKDLNSPRTKGNDDNYNSVFISSGAIEPAEKILVLNGTKRQDNDAVDKLLAIVPSQKRGGGNLWKKLFWRKKKFNSKNMTLPFAP